MADYVEAFKKGLEAAESADRAKKEINAVLKNLNEQLQEATKNKISIELKEYEIEKRQTLQDVLSNPFVPKIKEKYWAIVALNPSLAESPIKQLARWSIDRAGYPCKIIWSGEHHTCEDKEGLENSLTKLLQDPLIGEILHVLMQVEENNPEENPAQQ